jgi:hypothetical protein
MDVVRRTDMDTDRSRPPSMLDAPTAVRVRGILRAYERAEDAYAVARRLVFDPHPQGIPPSAQLSSEQRTALAGLRRATAELQHRRRQLNALATLRSARRHQVS